MTEDRLKEIEAKYPYDEITRELIAEVRRLQLLATELAADKNSWRALSNVYQERCNALEKERDEARAQLALVVDSKRGPIKSGGFRG